MDSPTARPGRELARRVARELRWRRRSAAAACGVVALAAGAHSLLPAPAATVPVLVASHDLVAGSTLGEADLRFARVPVADAPAESLTARDAAVGRAVVLPIGAGEQVTPDRLLGATLLTAFGPDTVAAPVHLADADTGGLVRAGDAVDVLAAGESGAAWVVASDARVLVAPTTSTATLTSASDIGAVVVVAVPSTTATALARAAATARLSVVLRGS